MNQLNLIRNIQLEIKFLYLIGLMASIFIFILRDKPEIYATIGTIFFIIAVTAVNLIVSKKVELAIKNAMCSKENP